MKRASLLVVALCSVVLGAVAFSVSPTFAQQLRNGFGVASLVQPLANAVFASLSASTVTASTSVQTPQINGAGGMTRITLPASATDTIMSTAPTTGSAVGHVLDTSATYASGDKVLQLKSGGTELAYVNGTGSWVLKSINAYNSTPFVIAASAANGASAVGVQVQNANALSTTGAKAFRIMSDSGSTEQAYLIKDANGWNWRVEGKPAVTYNAAAANPKTILSSATALSSGAATVTFSTAFAAAPICTCSDTAGGTAAACNATPTTTQVALTGTGTHIVDWICIGDR